MNMLLGFAKILTTFLLLGSVNADPSNFNLGDSDLSSKLKLLETQYVGGDQYISSLYSSGIDYSTNTIDSLLISGGYEPLNSTLNTVIIKKTTIIDISNPFGIEVDGCSTVTANLDEALAVLLYAIQNAMGVLPELLNSRMMGLPNLDNPKAIFNWIYDMTTTVMCMGTSGVTQAIESSIEAIPLLLKNSLSTANDEETDTSSNTQINAACGARQAKDSYTEKKDQGKNVNANEQTGGALTSSAILEQDKKFHNCKIKYEEYKKYISDKISIIDVYRDREVDKMKTSCDLLNAEEKKKSGDIFFPESGTWPLANPFYLNIVQPEIFSSTFGAIDWKIKVNENNSSKKGEMRVDRKRLADQILNIDGKIPQYATSSNVSLGRWNYVKGNEIPEYIFNLGINYANIITGCISGDPQFDTICNSEDIKNYFPMKLNPTVDNPSFLEKVKRQRLFCDLTDFNKEDNNFLISSIGLVTILDSMQKGIDHEPTIEKFSEAVNTVILGDYCSEKINMNIDVLEETMMIRLMSEISKVNQKERGLLSASKIWKDQEIVVTIPSQFKKDQVVKVCNVHKRQKNFFIATVIKDSAGKLTNNANIHKIEAKFSSNKIIDIKSLEKKLKIKLDGNWDACTNGDSKCGFLENALYAPMEIEMLCDEVAGSSLCPVDRLSCGINFAQKSASEREDDLYVDNDSETKPKGKYAQYEFKRREEKLDASEDDFNQKIDKGFKKDIDKIIYFAKNVLSPASKDLMMFIQIEVKKQMIALRK